MALKFYNTLTKRLEEFYTINPGEVRMYTCGPTVYDYAHIGNFRTYIFEDLLRRYLKYKGFRVVQVMNITDVDDKTIRRSREEGVSLKDYTSRYTEAFFEDIDTLRIERAEFYPHATEHIGDMVALIQKLIKNGYAYEVQGSWYYDVSKFKGYGKLSGVKLDELKPGARVSADEYTKEEVHDFALWKAYTPDDGGVFWETPLGKGRPGWHIECSAMSMRYLGNHFDIHTGGVDNIFPHHENEIAQSEAATGEKFVNFWLHSAYLIVEGEKMSKSKGNFYTLRDILKRGYDPVVVRYLLLSSHYRQQLNFTFSGLDAAKSSLFRIWDFIDNLGRIELDLPHNPEVDTIIETASSGFTTSLDDDLNISGALGALFNLVRRINRLISSGSLGRDDARLVLEKLSDFNRVLDIFPRENAPIEDWILEMIKKRDKARKNRDWETADRIRDELQKKGIMLQDTPKGTVWKKR
ncbi:cysteine--tRNA ligase [bacterium]|nr:cysteine--tRNA ligase [bacterium]